ncbi:MAG TPA: hypothetical protein VMT53_25130, partial [Terriglobales bacterium]|nr:hypothetical protein [Terriglobales bacterium]
VVALLQPLHCHPPEFLWVPPHSFLCHLQFLSLPSVPFPSVSFLGFSPGFRCGSAMSTVKQAVRNHHNMSCFTATKLAIFQWESWDLPMPLS